MKQRAAAILAWVLLSSIASAQAITRPPAVPLITHDPYMSAWSMGDHLYDDWPKHWTGHVHAMCGIVRVDGEAMRFMGAAAEPAKTAEQTGLRVTATTTTYTFRAGGITLTVTFTNPLLIEDLDILTRPAGYVTFEAASADEKPHDVQVYFDATAEWAVNTPDQDVVCKRLEVAGLDAMAAGTKDQPLLKFSGDNRRIDWGQFMVAAEAGESTYTRVGFADDLRKAFAKSGDIKGKDDKKFPRRADDKWPVLAATHHFAAVTAPVATHLIVAYDDEYAIQYLGENCRAWWRRDPAMTTEKLLAMAQADRAALFERCAAWDEKIAADARSGGGEGYADLCALAYRQCIAANKVVASPNGDLFMFPKENFSNGCIGTVDVIYPQVPLYLLYSPALAKASILPLLEYAATPRWKFDFAPHDLGQYPLANGQVYGGGEKTEDNQMPVEESGNMLLLLAGIAKREGNADFANAHWPLVSKWAAYLKDKGLDPENQLCTDDFAGHLAHNVNLSAKAILGLRAYGMLCEMTARTAEAAEYNTLAEGYAKRWMEMADDGQHYRLAFDKPGTWSQKYNLVWDKLLGLNLFPASVAATELAHYKSVQNKYGLPLDSRKDYTKLDWIVWTATLADNADDFKALLTPIVTFINETPDRVPLTDWYDTVSGKKIGFQARSVVGGVFIKTLSEKMAK